MEEYWDVYDKFRRKTGKVIKRNSTDWLKNDEYHIVVTGVIQNSKNQILISKRKKDKELFPELWECNGGSVKVGESSIEAILREIREELGIDFQKKDGELLGTVKKENYFRDIWRFKRDVKDYEINFCDGEVCDYKWVTIQEYVSMYQEGKIVPSGDFVNKFLVEEELEVER